MSSPSATSSDARASQDAPTPPSLDSSNTTSSLPPLPTEITHRIIQLALPRLSYTTNRERYDTLLPFTLVNSTWSALARKELFQYIIMYSAWFCKKLAWTFEEDSTLALLMRFVVVRGEHEWTMESDLCDVLDSCSQIKKVIFVGKNTQKIDLTNLADVVPSEYSRSVPCALFTSTDDLVALGVASLILHDFTDDPEYLKDPEASWFTHLHTLVVSDSAWLLDVTLFLKYSLPQLRHLALSTSWSSYSNGQDTVDGEDFILTVKHRAPSLESFTLLDCGSEDLSSFDWWTSMHGLHTLTIARASSASTLLGLIPSSILHLRFPRDYEASKKPAPASELEPIEKFLAQASSDMLRTLQSLSIPPHIMYTLEEPERAVVEDKLRAIEAACLRESVTLRYEDQELDPEVPDYLVQLVRGCQ